MIDLVASVFVAGSKLRKAPAASVPEPNMNNSPQSSSYLAPDAGVNENATLTSIAGVVPALLPTIHRSSVLPAVVSMIRNRNPSSPEPPRLASMLTPTAAGNAVVNVTLVVVAPAAIVPTTPSEGAKAEVEPAPNVPAVKGVATADCQPLLMMLYLYRIALETN